MNRNKAFVIGAGLAGCEAAWQLAERGISVELYEQKPHKKSPAHKADTFAELVCSNSLRAANVENAVGLLKEEMRRLGSLIMEAADACSVPAGGALAVDREGFSRHITQRIRNHPLIRVIEGEVTCLPAQEGGIVATGPLTEGAFFEEIQRRFAPKQMHFFDAAAPLIEADSINMSKAFRASRYGKGTADYLNCPMTEEEYLRFYEALVTAEVAPLHLQEERELTVFEGCMPVEVMAKRGPQTLCYGPLKPVGLTDPHTGKRPFAVVQLRQDDFAASLYNMVGFQTHLKFPEQKRVFSLIPGLENARFARYGQMHRNTYLVSPLLLDERYRLKEETCLYFAGQMTGVEGYVESAASGLCAGLHLARELRGMEAMTFPVTTALGALGSYIAHASAEDFQPMNINFGMMPPVQGRYKSKMEKNRVLAERSLSALAELLPQAVL
ncbi:MAG: methylenetetrahydrofolate--tRNA-(uracil(54)-C(5))-methyltransferase (FADH(2)-oxidizing) TrmFO [Clostridia bacterium]|nr:methylenetetrahydrofolate--tRNA-(uracil(54)-C(5))-methyltransferase (FADH(2)-oxidizing) TrmFO [Clostridia bacterium]